jgi:hypothetical protein
MVNERKKSVRRGTRTISSGLKWRLGEMKKIIKIQQYNAKPVSLSPPNVG